MTVFPCIIERTFRSPIPPITEYGQRHFPVIFHKLETSELLSAEMHPSNL